MSEHESIPWRRMSPREVAEHLVYLAYIFRPDKPTCELPDFAGFGRAVAELLDGREWGSDTLEEIGSLAERHGIDLREPETT